METINDQTFTATTVRLDGKRFVRVRFYKCDLVYEGVGEVDFEDCTFEQVVWSFVGASERTLAFLETINAKAGPDGVDLVEQIARSIRESGISHVHVRADDIGHAAGTETASVTVREPSVATG